MKAILNADQEMLSIVNVDVEFTFKGIVNMYASFDANFIILTIPVSFVRDGYSIPSVWIQSSQLGTDTSNDTFGEDVWL